MQGELDPSGIQRAPRVKISGLHDLLFIVTVGDEEIEIKVSNLSISGLGLLSSKEYEFPKENGFASGFLLLNRQRIPVTFQIVHQSPKVVGGKFTEIPDLLRNQITKYFDVELAALEMNQVNSKFLKEQEDGEPRWFKSGDQTELFFVEKNESLVRFHMSFLGFYLEGGNGRTTRCGKIIDEWEQEDETGYKGSSVIQYESEVSQLVKKSAIRLIDGIKELDKKIKNQIFKIIQDGK